MCYGRARFCVLKMTEILMSLVTGAVVGTAFGFLRLPIPAPPTLAGIAGVVGVFLGFVIINFFRK